MTVENEQLSGTDIAIPTIGVLLYYIRLYGVKHGYDEWKSVRREASERSEEIRITKKLVATVVNKMKKEIKLEIEYFSPDPEHKEDYRALNSALLRVNRLFGYNVSQALTSLEVSKRIPKEFVRMLDMELDLYTSSDDKKYVDIVVGAQLFQQELIPLYVYALDLLNKKYRASLTFSIGERD